jgi:hypothetical protein
MFLKKFENGLKSLNLKRFKTKEKRESFWPHPSLPFSPACPPAQYPLPQQPTSPSPPFSFCRCR